MGVVMTAGGGTAAEAVEVTGCPPTGAGAPETTAGGGIAPDTGGPNLDPDEDGGGGGGG